MVKILNSSRFVINTGDKLMFNPIPLLWVTKKSGTVIDYVDLINRIFIVEKLEWDIDDDGFYYIVWVSCQKGYTGLSSFIEGDNIDIWYIDKFGKCSKNSPGPLFRRIK